jgi:maltose/moltooligosaccharide transporter
MAKWRHFTTPSLLSPRSPWCRVGPMRVHAAALVAGGAGMIAIAQTTHVLWLFPAAAGVGICWGSIMGSPYVLLAASIPPERTGVYMGIFNMMIVVPMIVGALTFPLYYDALLDSNACRALMLAGLLLFVAAAASLRADATPLSSTA